MNIIYSIYDTIKIYLFIFLIFLLCYLCFNEKSNDKYILFPISILFIQLVIITDLENKKLKTKQLKH
jgi:hypothetical protein